MVTAQAMATIVHTVLRQSGFQRATNVRPGYAVSVKTTLVGAPEEIQVNCALGGVDAETAVLQYYAELRAAPTLTGCTIRFVTDPFPGVIIRGG